MEIKPTNFRTFDVGENIILPVPEFDKRSPFDYRNLGCVILKRTEDCLYRIENSSERLADLYTCNQFSISMSQFLTPADVPDKNVTLRQASLIHPCANIN